MAKEKKAICSLTLHGFSELPPKAQEEALAWLKGLVSAIRKERKNLSKRFTARYFKG